MIALIAAATADLATFGIALMAYPVDAESNPLARALYLAGGFPAVAAGKMLAVWAAIAVVRILASRWPTGARRGYRLAVGTTVFAAGTNVLAVWIAL